MKKNLETTLKNLEFEHERDISAAYKMGLSDEIIALMDAEYDYLRILAIHLDDEAETA